MLIYFFFQKLPDFTMVIIIVCETKLATTCSSIQNNVGYYFLSLGKFQLRRLNIKRKKRDPYLDNAIFLPSKINWSKKVNLITDIIM